MYGKFSAGAPMKRYWAIVPALALGMTVSASAQKARDATVVDPKVHNVLFENDHVRVLEARASHPASSPMHSHPPFVFIGLDAGRAKMRMGDGKIVVLDLNPGQVMWVGDGMEHSWELVSGKVRVIAVEVKSALKRPAGALSAVTRKSNDAVALDPDVHNVLLENDHVRVFDARAGKGRKSPMHSHPPFVFISLGTARLNMGLPDGKSVIFDTYPGQVLWMENLEHSWEILSGDPHVIAVEVKSAQRAMQAKAN
jgi:mannose-6-phosphate isomerase-like protein (cupin superfamily)